MANGYNTVLFSADTAGCGFYRMKFPVMALQTITRDVNIIDSMKLIGDARFFKDIRVVRLQRQVSNEQASYFLDFLKPLSKSIGFWLIYEIDDVIKYEDIPDYNTGKDAFKSDKFFENIKAMLNASDFITVTTETLKEYYMNTYEIDESKFIVINNYLPRWWAGESYNLTDVLKRYTANSKKPRIGFPASGSHFDIKNVCDGNDDFTHIIDFIRKNVNKYQFVFMGHYPSQIKDLVEEGKVEVHPGADLLNYPRELYAKDLQCIIAPLKNNIFNRCKSNIKLIEGWALGIPVFAQNLSCYDKYTDMLFDNSIDLEIKVEKFLNDSKKYKATVKKCRKIVDIGDKESPKGWWLEKNLQKWYNIFAIPQKTLELNLDIKPKDEVELTL